MSSDAGYDLRLVGVGKRYRVGPPAGWRRLLGGESASREEFWALRNVTFDVARGEVLGVIGANGAGKSTLLKLLSSITAPTEGEIRIRGRIAALIEVGSGFHPELTGRENVFLSGTILGLRRRDIAARLDGIADFAGIGNFMDVPVKWYSSGMYVRLGFAVAAQLEPDILLVDEVLAVGDAEFQARCLQRILDLRRSGTTIVFISHDLGTVERLCERALLVASGRVLADGPARDVVTTYLRSIGQPVISPERTPEDAGDRPVTIANLTVVDATGQDRLVVRSGDSLAIEVALNVHEALPAAVVTVSLYTYEDGVLLCEFRTPEEGARIEAGHTQIRFDIPTLSLLPGTYTLGATVRPAGVTRAVDWWFGRTTLHIESGPSQNGQFYLPYRWSIGDAPEPASRTRYTTVHRSA
jgi:homopolymeric O-antigen transport system ATP-binding protein